MTGNAQWRDATSAAEALTDADRRILQPLVRLPLIWEGAIERLLDLRGGASVYRCLARLREMGLVDEIRPALRAGRNPGLLYLTDLGIATVAVDRHLDSEHLARRARLRGTDLLARVPGVPHLLAAYQLLVALASARPGHARLVSWEQPWRRTVRRPGRAWQVSVRIPAHVVLSWAVGIIECFLIPDLATFSLRVYRSSLRRLLTLRRGFDGPLPTLVVATTDARRSAWNRLLEDIEAPSGSSSIDARVVTWRELRDDTTALRDVAVSAGSSVSSCARNLRLRAGEAKHPSRRIPQPVGPSLRHRESADWIEAGALAVTPQERMLLDLVGRHPFLPAASLATVLGWEVRRVRERRQRLLRLDLVRLLNAEEVGGWPGDDLTELTESGLRLVAAQHGLSLTGAIRFNGLAGGGPDCPTGTRQLLIRNLSHTVGADEIFVGLHQIVRAIGTSSDDDAVLEWRNAASCSRRRVRPDGYGMVRLSGQPYGFFLEYDRGTMSARDYREKWAAYYDYRDSRAFEHDYDGFPTVLVVTTSNAVEERIARTVRAVSVGRSPTLPILLTSEWRIARDPTNPRGLLGAIWCPPRARSRERIGWPAPMAGAKTGAP